MRNLFLITPRLSISTSTTSPSRNHTGGFIARPTPDGVPVIITVPGRSVLPLLRNLTMVSMPNSRSSVRVSCRSSPLTLVVSRRLPVLGRAWCDVMTGPMGANLSKDLEYGAPARSCQNRQLTSLPTVYPRIYERGSSEASRFLHVLPMMIVSSP